MNCLEIEVASESGQVANSQAMIELLQDDSAHHFTQLLPILLNGKLALAN